LPAYFSTSGFGRYWFGQAAWSWKPNRRAASIQELQTLLPSPIQVAILPAGCENHRQRAPQQRPVAEIVLLFQLNGAIDDAPRFAGIEVAELE
jgi:hypothetical protein